MMTRMAVRSNKLCAEGLKKSIGGRDGNVDVFFCVAVAYEQRLELAAWHIDAVVDEGPEILGKEFAIRSICGWPIHYWSRIEEQCQHAAYALHCAA